MAVQLTASAIERVRRFAADEPVPGLRFGIRKSGCSGFAYTVERVGDVAADDQVFATYCHGLFDHPEALTALLAWAGISESAPVDFAARREADLERLADAVEAALDWQKMAVLLPGQASV